MYKLPCCCRCIITKSSYTQQEDFASADLVVDSLEAASISLDTASNLLLQPSSV
jgi:hypothetical protein